MHHPPGWCDGSHIAPECPPHTSLLFFSTNFHFPHIYYVVECIVDCWLSCWLYILSCTECTEQFNSYVPVNHPLAGPNRICTWITPQKLCIPVIHKVSHVAQCLFIRPYILANCIILAINKHVELSAPFDTFYKAFIHSATSKISGDNATMYVDFVWTNPLDNNLLTSLYFFQNSDIWKKWNSIILLHLRKLVVISTVRFINWSMYNYIIIYYILWFCLFLSLFGQTAKCQNTFYIT